MVNERENFGIAEMSAFVSYQDPQRLRRKQRWPRMAQTVLTQLQLYKQRQMGADLNDGYPGGRIFEGEQVSSSCRTLALSRIDSMRESDPRRRLLNRHANNPLLSAYDWPYFVNTVFNPVQSSTRHSSKVSPDLSRIAPGLKTVLTE